MTDLLIEGIDYDLWANQRWLDVVRTANDDALNSVFTHLIAVLVLWHLRVLGEAPSGPPTVEITPEFLELIHARWTEAIFANRHDPVIKFRRFDGEAMAMPFSRIVRHVVNHGSYHRGELRGICRNLGRADFPETDLLYYYRENPLV